MNTNVTTNFNYEDAQATVSKIESLTDELVKILNAMNNIVADNINNPSVWKGESAEGFKNKWNSFAENFPAFVSTFKTQSNNVRNAIDSYHAWEQSNK